MIRTYLSPPHVGEDERRLLLEAFDSNWLGTLGPQVDAFEREMAERIGVRHAVALSSGTAAIHLALIALGVTVGDVVLTPTLTFAASANPITYLGATPVFIDCERATWNMDPDLLAEEIGAMKRAGKLPKAVIAVDLYGQCADYDRILAVCAEHGVPLVEDAAEALGATYQGKSAGTFGACAALSFNGNKIITTSGGGMLVTDREEIAKQARHLALQAREPVIHYEHKQIGYNYRLSNILAAMGRAQLRKLDDRIATRRGHFEYYKSALAGTPGIDFMPLSPKGEWNGWLSVLLIDPAKFGRDREELRLLLLQEGIESRPAWKPMHLQPVFQGHRVVGGAVAADVFDRGLCLPSGSNLPPAERERITQVILASRK